MIDEYSYGIVPLRRKEDIWELFLIQHTKGKHWGFPKGKAEESELPLNAAIRELFEETGLRPTHFLKKEPLVEEYRFVRNEKSVKKRVLFFIAEVEGEVSLPPHEISEGRWVSFAEANHLLTHKETRHLLESVISILWPA